MESSCDVEAALKGSYGSKKHFLCRMSQMSKVEAVRSEVVEDKVLEERGIHGTMDKSVPLRVCSDWTQNLALPAYFQSDRRDRAIAW